MKTERLKVTIAYDGRTFRGWQSQACGSGVQDHVERSLAEVCGGRIVVHGSGRTDTGVHALGQVAHVDVPRGRLAVRAWQLALNANLPHAIRVVRVQRAAADFHARFDVAGKLYLYRIWHASYLHPLEIGRAWLVPGKLDLSLLREGARRLEGTHDFALFAANRRSGPIETVRTINRIRLARRGPLLTLRFDGTGFLYKMVRLLTGSLIRCAQGRAPLSWLDELLQNKGAAKTHFAAPAEGLYLERVRY